MERLLVEVRVQRGRKRALNSTSGIHIQETSRRVRSMSIETLFSLLLLLLLFVSRADATYIQCAAAAGSNVANVQICPTGQCCGVNGYCGVGQGYCGKGNCLAQCSSSATTVSPPGLLLPPPPPSLLPPPPPEYYYGSGGATIVDLDNHHHHGVSRAWKIVGIVAAVGSLVLLALILCVLLAWAARKRHKHACECDHL